MRTTEEIATDLAGFEPAVRDLVWEVISDLRDSYRLAMADYMEPDDIERVEATVSDFLANNYGDD